MPSGSQLPPPQVETVLEQHTTEFEDLQ